MEKHKNKIINFFKKYKRIPSYSEIMDITGLKSKNSVFRLVNKLVDDDVLEKDAKGKLVPKRMFGQLKVLGSVEAGFPATAEEEFLDTISLDEYLIENRDATFILKVRGDSMIDAGIMNGDMVVVQRETQPHSGDIVIAEVDGEWTMKYLSVIRKKVCLLPANKKYKSIFPKAELRIAAVVKAVIRKYH